MVRPGGTRAGSERATGAEPVVELRTLRASRHPWIWRKMVRPARIPAGAVVRLRDRSGTWVGRGFYHPASEIAVRVLTDDPDEVVDRAFLARRVASARDLRTTVLRLPETTDAWRVVNAEGDGCSGLVVDRFADHVVALCYARGWWERREELTAVLREAFPGARVHVRTDARAAKREGMPVETATPERTVVREADATFAVDAAGGHKTGFFLDQRDTRLAFASLAAGRTVLDACCYTGAFAIHAARAGARRVTAVDLDEAAIAVAQENGTRNGVAVEWLHADAFEALREAPVGRYDAVVLDPPGWGKVREELPKAMHQYRDLNRLAFERLAPGGILCTCACAGLVSVEMFLTMLREAAELAGRDLRLLRVGGAAADHPVPLHFPEGRYLTTVLGVVA